MKKLYLITGLSVIIILFFSGCNNTNSRSTNSPHLATEANQENIIVNTDPSVGGSMVFPIYQDPRQLNPFLLTTGETALVSKLIYEGLADIGPNGQFYPRLAKELPTKENGGVTDDGLTITWKLREGVFWSDGEPFTSDDVKFTWEFVTFPGSPAYAKSQGWRLIDSIETPDDYTVVVHYRSFYYNYLDQFIGYESGILPRHSCGNPSDITNWDCNRNPIGTGPFILSEWKPNESLTLIRNPNYRDTSKPYLDRIVFPIIPDENIRKSMLISGEGDAMLWVNFEQTNELEASGVQVTPGTDMWLLRLGFNLAGGPEGNSPHPILEDLRIRQAIQLAVDPRLITQGVLDDRGQVISHELYHGLTPCPSPQIEYSKDQAAALLEEAGWIDTNSDGIRECVTCDTVAKGTPMELTLVTSSDPPTYARMGIIISDELREVGINVTVEVPEDMWERFGNGDFDLGFWDDGYTSDPLGMLGTYYRSDSIGEGNIFRYKSDTIDEMLEHVSTITDSDERLQYFCQIDQLLLDDLPSIWIASMPYPDAFSARMAGWTANPSDYMTWDAENWYIKP